MSTKHSKAAEKVNRNPEWVTRHDKTFWSVRAKRDDQAHGLKEWEQLREAASQIKKHTVTHLADYLEQFEQNAIKNGAIVHWARMLMNTTRLCSIFFVNTMLRRW